MALRIDFTNHLGKFYPRHQAAEAVIFAAAGSVAFLLRFDFWIPQPYIRPLVFGIVIWIVIKLCVFHVFRVSRCSRRFFSLRDAVRLARANIAGSVLTATALLLFVPGFPRSIPVLDWVLCTLLTSSALLLTRVLTETKAGVSTADFRRVLIYGAGHAGVMLQRELRVNYTLGFRVTGFIDDDARLRDYYVDGVKVLGGGKCLKDAVSALNVKEVLIAIPSATTEQMTQIVKCCHQASVKFRTVAAMGRAIQGNAPASEIREVDVHDLLDRTPICLDDNLIQSKIRGRVVMVTGAAGSIGSELCRQLARFSPAAIVGFELAETPLFHLEREMRTTFPDLHFFPVIGSVQNLQRLDSVVALHQPAIVYHAAAYKHVPIMESSLIEAVENNVVGTFNVATTAYKHNVEEFVLISTDKSVRPTSVMGATKRICELLVLSMPKKKTRFVAVRFGNVLGSNGSVIPLFQQQIARGGPITVKHPEMRRYFMTIPEATQLVLQASAMGVGGEIFELEMGNQVRITDLAKKMILLAGLVPDVDIKIEFSGIRPGEKLYEELFLDQEATIPTTHPKVRVLASADYRKSDVIAEIERLQLCCSKRNARELLLLMSEMVTEYVPSKSLLGMINPDFSSEVVPQAEPISVLAATNQIAVAAATV